MFPKSLFKNKIKLVLIAEAIALDTLKRMKCMFNREPNL